MPVHARPALPVATVTSHRPVRGNPVGRGRQAGTGPSWSAAGQQGFTRTDRPFQHGGTGRRRARDRGVAGPRNGPPSGPRDAVPDRLPRPPRVRHPHPGDPAVREGVRRQRVRREPPHRHLLAVPVHWRAGARAALRRTGPPAGPVDLAVRERHRVDAVRRRGRTRAGARGGQRAGRPLPRPGARRRDGREHRHGQRLHRRRHPRRRAGPGGSASSAPRSGSGSSSGRPSRAWSRARSPSSFSSEPSRRSSR